MVKNWEEFIDSDSNFKDWLKAYTKKCPKCHKNIEKNQGCNHMTCDKASGGCGHQFCWLCLNNWRNHSKCKPIDIQNAEESAIKTKNNYQQNM